jgi:hypothetical protein
MVIYCFCIVSVTVLFLFTLTVIGALSYTAKTMVLNSIMKIMPFP